MNFLGEQSLRSLITIIKTELTKLLPKPTTTGTTGQVLKRGQNDTTQWDNLAPTTSNVLKGDNNGGIVEATPDTDYLKPNGNGSDLSARFNMATTHSELLSGESVSTLFSKTSKWLHDLGSMAFVSEVDKTNLSEDVQQSLEKADTALQSAPVVSVNGQTGEVVLDLDSLPKVTTDDNGKFLRVVDGVWSATEISNASGVNF